MNKKLTKFILITIAIFLPIIVFAANTDRNDKIFISQDETIVGNFMAATESVVVDGIISGDLIVATNSLTVNGRVEGDILAIAESIVINGEIGGNVRIIGNYININGSIARNVNALGSDIIIGENTKIGWDILIAANSANVGGNIEGSINSYVQKIIITAKIGKNVDIRILKNNDNDSLKIDKSAIINGDLTYHANQKLALNENNIAGQINFKPIQVKSDNVLLTWVWNRLFSILSIIFIGLVLIFAFTTETKNLISFTHKKYLKSLLIGSIFFMIIPVLSIILLFTIIGLPLALVLMGLWLAGILLAKSLASIYLGDLILGRIFKSYDGHLFWSLLLGAIILSLLFSLLWFGWLFRIITICLALGSLLIYVTNKSKNI